MRHAVRSLLHVIVQAEASQSSENGRAAEQHGQLSDRHEQRGQLQVDYRAVRCEEGSSASVHRLAVEEQPKCGNRWKADVGPVELLSVGRHLAPPRLSSSLLRLDGLLVRGLRVLLDHLLLPADDVVQAEAVAGQSGGMKQQRGQVAVGQLHPGVAVHAQHSARGDVVQ